MGLICEPQKGPRRLFTIFECRLVGFGSFMVVTNNLAVPKVLRPKSCAPILSQRFCGLSRRIIDSVF
jgi:hypothetical protein